MRDLFDLTGKVVIVTGGYGHLGSGMVNSLLQANATVYVAGRSKEKFESKFSKNSMSNLNFVHIDIMNTESILKCFNEVYNKHKRIDVLINNAHSAKGRSQANLTDDDFLYTLDGVLGSIHRAIREIIPFMKRNNSGKIINISSMYGIVSPDFRLYDGDNCEKYTNPPHYGAAKAGMNQITKYYAVVLGKYNIQVNGIAPGPFPKLNIQEENPKFIERLKSRNPLHKIGKPEDLGGPVVLLSSSGSDFITGQIIQVDGGWTIW